MIDAISHATKRVFMASVIVIFFMGGLIASFNSIVVPHLKSLFHLQYRQAMLIDFAFNITFLVISYPAGIVLGRRGYTYTLKLGLIAFAVGCITIYPAIELFSYPLILLAIFILGIGFNLILVAGSPFLAALGDSDTSASRITLGQAFMAVGQTLAPLLGSLYLLRDASAGRDEMGSDFQTLYLVFAGALIMVFFVTSSVKYNGPLKKEEKEIEIGGRTLWNYRQLVFGFIAVFVYLGIEAYLASVFINFVSGSDIGNMPASDAGIYLTIFWLCFTVARFAGSFIQRKVKTNKWLAVNVVLAMVVITAVIFLKGPIVVWLLISLAVFNAIMFPSIYSLGIRGLGSLEAKGSGVLFVAISGAAIIPIGQGALADSVGLQYSFLVSLLCYGYLLFYALYGYRPGSFRPLHKAAKIS